MITAAAISPVHPTSSNGRRPSARPDAGLSPALPEGQPTQSAVPPARQKNRVHGCAECGADASRAASFCGDACRHAFNNRRRVRGAEIYDLFMALRFERRLGTALGLFQAICRLASDFRAEDRASRDGRKSWRHPRTVLSERPHLKAVSTQDRTGRRRRA